jgi:cytochrome c-type protein NapB
MMKKSLIAMAALSVMALSVSAAEKAIPEEELGLRKTSLFEEKVTPATTEYSKAAPGTAKKIERSYMNAPPLIPHSVEGLLPITRKNNQCLSCHMPDVAKGVGATPIPASHFASFRPDTKIGKNGEVIKEGKAVKNTADIKTVVHKMDKLNQARFNCSQCHVPQANVKPLVENTFQPEFSDPALKGKSNLLDVINEGVK